MSQSAAAARAAEHQHAAHLAVAAQVAEYSTERGGKQAKGEASGTQVAAVRAELAQLGAEQKKGVGGSGAGAVPSPGDGISGSEGARVRETVLRLGQRHGLVAASEGAMAVLTRDALEAAELDMLLEVELQCTPVDPLGRRRLPKALWQVNTEAPLDPGGANRPSSSQLNERSYLLANAPHRLSVRRRRPSSTRCSAAATSIVLRALPPKSNSLPPWRKLKRREAAAVEEAAPARDSSAPRSQLAVPLPSRVMLPPTASGHSARLRGGGCLT